MTAAVVDDDLVTRLNQIWEAGDGARAMRAAERRKRPRLRLWDGDWNYVGTIHDAIEGKFQWKLNDTGEGTVKIPTGTWIANWVRDAPQRTSRNIHITMDKDGARWGGRLERSEFMKESDGRSYLQLTFLHDFEELKHIYCWPNPFLPAAIQFPRAFILAGPTAWALKMMLHVNLLRLNGNLWALPDDPLDLKQWGAAFDQSQWPIVVAPGPLVGDSSPWTVVSSRMKLWSDVAAAGLADAQLSVECRRWLEGDPPPWPGAKLRSGALVVDIVDKSGWWSAEGTSVIGSIWTGLVRSVQAVVGEVDVRSTVIPAPTEVPEYQQKNWLGTSPHMPYVVFREGNLTGVKASNFVWKPATSVQEITGGHSMPGTNEAISAAVQLAGNYLGALVMVPGAGKIADTFLAPIYSDTLLAWMTIKSLQRAQAAGWSRYQEHFAQGADRGYTLSALVALRKGFWDTRETFSHKLEIHDGAPWYIGDRGHGHFFIGDRIGGTIKNFSDDRIVVEQVTDLAYTFDRSSRGWEATCGDPTSQRSPLEMILGKTKVLTAALHDLGLV